MQGETADAQLGLRFVTRTCPRSTGVLAAPNLGADPNPAQKETGLLLRTQSPSAAEPGAIAYRRVSPGEQPPPERVTRLVSAITAPMLGSRLLFPARFDAASDALMSGPTSAGVPTAHARWYFRTSLNLDINPALLRRRLSDFVATGAGAHWVGSWFLDAGDWTLALAPLRGSPVHREIHQLIAADLDFRRIPAYQAQLRAALAGAPVKRNGVQLASVAELDAYYRYCIALVQSIAEVGVVRSRFSELVRISRLKHAAARPPALDFAEGDIGVAINADGEMIRHLGGKHRTAIAQALKIPKIPVEVRFVHVRWLAREATKLGLAPHLALPHAIASLGEQWRS